MIYSCTDRRQLFPAHSLPVTEYDVAFHLHDWNGCNLCLQVAGCNLAEWHVRLYHESCSDASQYNSGNVDRLLGAKPMLC